MSTEPLDLTGFKRAKLADQPQPQMIWARLEELVIDHRYQRNLTLKGRGAIQRIANGWDWRKYQPILVAPAEMGKLAIVYGQHRAHAAALVGLEAIPAMTVAMTLQEQAAGFAAVNRDRVSISQAQIYRAELAAGTEWAVAAREAVEAGGCRLTTSNPSAATKKPRVVYGIGLIRRMVNNGEAEAIAAGLRAITESDQRDEIDVYGGAVLSPWLSALAQNQRFLRLDLAMCFDTLDIRSMLDKSRVRARQTGDSARAIVTAEIVERLTVRSRAAA
ncbi:ParB/Srx family N-terminal domain-containing protein [Citreimonas sp.]|uniref:ParB/Srx family N-terminal domain-containing protein n=1 Tax=Citreimonas sp. TaxID=3036715 RepID=UPI004057F30B